MTVEELVAAFRQDTDDLRPKFRWTTAQIVRWLGEAEEEAAIRKRLLLELDAVPIDILANVTGYQRSPQIFEVTKAYLYRAGLTRDPIELELLDADQVQRDRMRWIRRGKDRPRAVVIAGSTVTFTGPPDRAYTLHLEGYRTPLVPLNTEDMQATPEIAPIEHRFLLEWAKYKGYRIPDSEIFNASASEEALEAFEGRFGTRWQSGRGNKNKSARNDHVRGWY